MHFPLNLSLSVASRLFFGSLALGVTSASLQAQTYYYYPTSAASASPAPVQYYYYPTTYTQQPAATTIAPQYYQVAYPQQVYQASYAAPTYPATYATQAAVPTQAPAVAQPEPAPAVAQPATTSAQPAEAAAAPVYSGDPYGFTTWLNATRAAYGLAAVGYDPNLAGWAAANNDQQAARGMGHFVMGPASRQNSAVGSFPGIESMWMASPAHRAALLDPTIRWIGIAGLGAYWTFNAN